MRIKFKETGGLHSGRRSRAPTRINITSVACAVCPSVTTSPTDFSFQNLVFWNLFEFSTAEITFKSLSPTF